MNKALLKELNLSIEDYKAIIQRIEREPSLVELGLFSAMWSEHCSYRSSKHFLKKLPTRSPLVVQGPGENAGVIKLNEEQFLSFKVESHNHPSAVEPFQGAATGVGGIIRDIFTMGARPIAILDSLSFDYPREDRARFLLDGVIGGISFYGNCVGVPNSGGETHFDSCYRENPLVNVMCIGVLHKKQLQSSAARTTGAKVIYVGAKTGRDGIHGASFASGVLDEEAKKRKSSVQVGDPFLEKLLIEAVLEIIDENLVEAIQDMGAAGLTSSSVEMAAKGGKGIELRLDRVPLREPDITPFEMMLSESQERMLMVVKSEHTDRIKVILEKWQLDYAEIGHITNTQRICIFFQENKICDLSLSDLLDAPPVNQIIERDVSCIPDFSPGPFPKDNEWSDWIKNYCSQPDQGQKNWIFEQYDTTLLTNTVIPPGYGATLLYLKESGVFLGLTLNSMSQWCAIDPYKGVMAILSVAGRRLSALGTQPSAITNCLNFGNPVKPHVLWEFSQTIEGMKDWLEFFDIPVVSGNVSFYNEGKESSIYPTPVIGMVGQANDLKPLSPYLYEADLVLAILGETRNERFSSQHFPILDLKAEKHHQAMLRSLILGQSIVYAKSIDQGGLIKTLLSCASQGECGISIKGDFPLSTPEYLMSESHGRFLIAFKKEKHQEIVQKIGHISLDIIGKTLHEPLFEISPARLPLNEIKQTMRDSFHRWMNIIRQKERSVA